MCLPETRQSKYRLSSYNLKLAISRRNKKVVKVLIQPTVSDEHSVAQINILSDFCDSGAVANVNSNRTLKAVGIKAAL